ncbi:MAG: hypothetical protein ACR2F2_05865 [Pyrinomonadaceae bacterium]
MKKVYRAVKKSVIYILNNSYKLDHWWLGYLICLTGFIITIAAFYPGMMSPDSIDNFNSGRQGIYRDIASPVMSYLWGLLDSIFPGPALMFVLQNLLFWCGCAIFWYAARTKHILLRLLLVLFGFMPQIISQLTTVWKDVQLAAAFFFVSALLYFSKQTKYVFPVLITPVFLFYGYAVRLNAAAAVLPLAVWTGIIFCELYSSQSFIQRKTIYGGLTGIVYFFVLTAGVYFVNNKLTEGKTVYPSQQIFLYDLAAISLDRNEPLLPEYVLQKSNFSLENVKTGYNFRSVNSLIYGDHPKKGDSPILKLTQNPDEITALKNKWYETVADNKLSYLRHRYFVFAQLNGFTRQTVSNPYWDSGFNNNPPEFRAEPNLLYKVLMKYFSLFKKYFLFRGYFWLALCFIIIYQAIKHKFQSEWQAVFFLSVSSILYNFAYFPTTPSTEFRYIFWSELAAAAAGIFAVYLLFKERSNKNGKNVTVHQNEN